MEFRGKHIVITGASTSIGRELAIELGRRGARVTVAARGALDVTVKAVIGAGGAAHGVPTDVGDREACRRLIEAAVARFGPPDALVHNAGISMWARFEQVTDL